MSDGAKLFLDAFILFTVRFAYYQLGAHNQREKFYADGFVETWNTYLAAYKERHGQERFDAQAQKLSEFLKTTDKRP